MSDSETPIDIPWDLNFLNGDINLTVPWYLMTSYLYYIEDVALLHDHQYDLLCEFMHKNWKHIKHRHKNCILQASLVAGTGFYLKKEDYPMIVVNAAQQLAYERGLF